MKNKEISKRLILSFVLFVSFLTNAYSKEFNDCGFQQFKIGNIEAIILTDGRFSFSPVQPTIAANVPFKELSEELTNSFRSDSEVSLSLNILLLKKDDHYILFDAGTGADNPNYGLLKKSLAIAGIDPNQITDIVITHAHFDHIGGLVNNNASVFPKATIYLSKAEYDSVFENKNPSDDFKNRQNILGIVKNQIKTVEDNETLLGSIKVSVKTGHTKGHMVATVFSENDKMKVIGDLVHYYAVLFPHPEWGIAYDTYFDESVAVRKEYLNKYHSAKSKLFGYHLPYPGVGYVKQLAKDSYQWIPFGFSMPFMEK